MIWILLIAYCRMIIMKTKAKKSKESSVAKNQIPTELYNKHNRRPIERFFYKNERTVSKMLKL